MRRKTISSEKVLQNITTEEVINKFTRHCIVKNLTQKTIKYYQDNFTYFNSIIPNIYISEINLSTIEDFIFMEKEKGKKVVTINSELRAIRALLYFSMERGYVDSFSIELLKDDHIQKEPYTNIELAKLLKKPKSKNWVEWRNWAIVNYLLATGNRVGTVVNIQIKDLDFENNRIILYHNKNRKQQIIPLSVTLKTVLKEYLSTWEYTDEDYLFPQYEGKQMAERTMQQAINKYNKSRGVTKTSVHLFRHTFAKNYVMAGGKVEKLQKLLGHSSITMTMHYINLYGTDLANDYDSFNPLNNILKAIS